MPYKHFSDIDQAKYAVVHDFKDGAERLATLIRMNLGTLYNKVNPSVETHHLSVDEAVSIQLATGDYRIVEAESRALGGVFVPILPANTNISDMALLDAWAEWHIETGETAAVIRDALSDGKIDRHEVEKIKTEMFEDFQRELQLLQRLEGICDGD